MGYRFSLVLSREISDEESAILQEAGPASAVFGTDSLPTNAQVTVTKMDFDVTESPSLAEAIESALEAVKKVPELSVPGLTVPAQPAHLSEEDSSVVAGEVVTDEPAADAAPQEAAETADGDKPAAKKPRAAKKAPAKKPSAAKKQSDEDKEPAEVGAQA